MTIFFRLLDAEDKGTALQIAIAALPQNPTPEAFAVNPRSFEKVSGTPFAYWVSTKTFELFERFSQFEVDDRKVRVGLQTSDDFRFVRNCWEAPIASIVSGSLSLGADEFRAKTFDKNKIWVPLAKGGDYSPYYADLHLVVNWKDDGEEIKSWVVSNASDPTTTHWSRNVRSADIYFQEGLTWTHRTTRAFSIRVLPRGSNSHFDKKLFNGQE